MVFSFLLTMNPFDRIGLGFEFFRCHLFNVDGDILSKSFYGYTPLTGAAPDGPFKFIHRLIKRSLDLHDLTEVELDATLLMTNNPLSIVFFYSFNLASL